MVSLMKKDCVKQLWSVTNADLARVIRNFIPNLHPDDHTVAFRAVAAIQRRSVSELQSAVKMLDPAEFIGVDHHVFTSRRQFLALFSKLDLRGIGTQSDREKLALNKWADSESRCRLSNAKFSCLRTNWSGLLQSRPYVARVLELASAKLAYMLPTFSVDSILEKARPGPGVTQGSRKGKGRANSAYYKLFDVDQHCTLAALPYATRLMKSRWWYGEIAAIPPVCIANASRYTTVPKDWRVCRPIAIEPSLNTMLQLGVHELWSPVLARIGNSITDQRRNGRMARLGSTLGGSVTIDLSSASDCISTGLVEFLFRGLYPFEGCHKRINACEWFDFLQRIRTTHMEVNGQPHRLEKFSPMGNGFTFVLETMVFLSLAQACAEVCGSTFSPSCYGDDIITCSSSSLLLTEVLEWCGLVVNTDKSYYFGPFRESCGFDWYEGEYCAPLYLRSKSGRLCVSSLFQLYNDAGLDDDFDWTGVKTVIFEICRQRNLVLWVRGDLPPTAGLQCHSPRMRYNSTLQRWEQTAYVETQGSFETPANDEQLLALNLLFVSTEEHRYTALRDNVVRRRRRVPAYGTYVGPLDRKWSSFRPYKYKPIKA